MRKSKRLYTYALARQAAKEFLVKLGANPSAFPDIDAMEAADKEFHAQPQPTMPERPKRFRRTKAELKALREFMEQQEQARQI